MQKASRNFKVLEAFFDQIRKLIVYAGYST